MRCSLWIRSSLAATLVLTMAPVLAQGLPTISVAPHEHQESRLQQVVAKTIRLDRLNPTTTVTGRFSMNQQRAVEGDVGVATPGPGCTQGVDFIELNQVPFTIPAGQLSTTVLITFCGDTVPEFDETLSLTIHAETLVGAQCSANGLSCKAQAKIINSPDNIFNSLVRVGTTRGEAGVTVPTTVSVPLHLEPLIVVNSGFTFSFRTVDGTASSGNPDHFAPGQCSGTNPATGATVTRDFIPRTGAVTSLDGVLGLLPIDIQICPKSTAQPEKSFFLQLFDLSATASLANGRGQVFIQDAPTLSVSNTTVSEPATGRRSVRVTASLLAVPVNPVPISFRTRNGTATAQIGATSICNGVGDFLGIAGGSTTIEAPHLGNIGGFTYICADTLTERDESFFFDVTVDTSRVRIADRTGRVTILDTPLSVGGFQFSPDRAQIKVDAITNFSVDWTLPEPQVWRNLNTIEMLVHDDDRDTITVLWKELENTFSLCRTPKASSSNRSGRGSNDNNDDDRDDDAIRSGIPRQGCSVGHLPGSDQVLETRYARLHLADTTVVGSGPTGQSVTLNMAISFKDKARGEQTIKLAASNDMRQSDPFVRAGRVEVVRAR